MTEPKVTNAHEARDELIATTLGISLLLQRIAKILIEAGRLEAETDAPAQR